MPHITPYFQQQQVYDPTHQPTDPQRNYPHHNQQKTTSPPMTGELNPHQGQNAHASLRTQATSDQSPTPPSQSSKRQELPVPPYQYADSQTLSTKPRRVRAYNPQS